MMRDSKIAGVIAMLTFGFEAIGVPSKVNVCLVELCVADKRVTERTVVAKLGDGIRVHRPDDVGVSRCYFDAASGVWADFTFASKEESSAKRELRGIMLSEHKMCEGSRGKHKASLGRRLAGASIGMAESEILASLGRPTRIDDARRREASKPSMADTRYSAKFGDSVYVYETQDNLGFTFVYFKDGRVRTIWFSESE